MFKVVIIEDEKIAAENLTRMLMELNANFEIIERIESVANAVYKLPTLKFDLVLMDIHLTDGSAFEILEKIELTKPIIFTTAYDKYVLKAFKYLSIDYLLKPIGKKELKLAIDKFQNYFANQSQNKIDLTSLKGLLKGEGNFKERFLVQVGKKLKPILVNHILYIHSSNKITFVNVEGGKSYPIDFSLSKLEKELNPTYFFRINRQYIVGLTAIQHIYMVSPTKMKVVLKSNPDLNLFTSIDRMSRFKNWMR